LTTAEDPNEKLQVECKHDAFKDKPVNVQDEAFLDPLLPVEEFDCLNLVLETLLYSFDQQAYKLKPNYDVNLPKSFFTWLCKFVFCGWILFVEDVGYDEADEEEYVWQDHHLNMLRDFPWSSAYQILAPFAYEPVENAEHK
jgi:hypothetical protein